MQAPDHIYKILDRDAWDSFVACGTFAGAAIDLTDGYIHFSTAGQVADTLALHFTSQKDLILVEVAVDRLEGSDLRFEPARDSLFPHLYAPLLMDAVTRHWALALDVAGTHILPEGLNS